MYMMNRYSVADARKQIARVLDEAEKGYGVIIERKGVLFRLALDEPKRPAGRAYPAQVEILDEAVEAGTWSWGVQPKGEITFVAAPKKRKRS